ncbi:hypothetical protein GCM10022247_05900 [Allokutzneria multivorans]|uniref:YqeB PH domain-containing protein n=1 Tax=Allokutzneria multivorans TaxID=1142134 RepID=A0ABP7QYX9_9PSEU
MGAVKVGMPATLLWLFWFGGAALGGTASFGIATLLGLSPTPLILLGAGAGALLAWAARKHDPVVTVAASYVLVHVKRSEVRLERDRIGSLFVDAKDLVVLDRAGEELARVRAADVPTARLREAFEHFEYPWADGPRSR